DGGREDGDRDWQCARHEQSFMEPVMVISAEAATGLGGHRSGRHPSPRERCRRAMGYLYCSASRTLSRAARRAQRAARSSRLLGGRASVSKSPVSYASTTAWTRSRRSSFWRMWVMCVLTVVSLM